MAGLIVITSNTGTCVPVHRRHKALADDRAQHHGELHAHLLLLIGREGIDNAVDGFGRAHRMQRGKQQMAGFRRGQRGLHGFIIAHFAKHNHVCASRMAARKARANELASLGISRWLTSARLWAWRYSIGSSMVMICTS